MKKILQKICTVALASAAIAGIGIAARTMAPELLAPAPASPDKTAPAPQARANTPQLRAAGDVVWSYSWSDRQYYYYNDWTTNGSALLDYNILTSSSRYELQSKSFSTTTDNSQLYIVTQSTIGNFVVGKEYTFTIGLGVEGNSSLHAKVKTGMNSMAINYPSAQVLFNETISGYKEYKFKFTPGYDSVMLGIYFTSLSANDNVLIGNISITEGWEEGGGSDPDPGPEPEVKGIKDIKVECPYEPNFDNQADRDKMSIIEGAPTSWTWTDKTNIVAGKKGWFIKSYKNTTNDWLITPGIYMESGKEYVLEFESFAENQSYPDPLTIKYGICTTIDDMKYTLLDSDNVKGSAANKENRHYTINCTETGYYNIGFYTAYDNGDGVYINNVSVKESKQLPPVAPSNVKAERNGNGVNVSWSTVTTQTDGMSISNVTYNVEVLGADGEYTALATGLSNTSYSYTPAESGFYTYRVKAIHKELESEYTESEVVYAGAALTELNETFETSNAYPWYLDAKNSSGTWAASTDYATDNSTSSMKVSIVREEGALYASMVNILSGVYTVPTDFDYPYFSIDVTKNDNNLWPYLQVYYREADNANAEWVPVIGSVYPENAGVWETSSASLESIVGKNVQFKIVVSGYQTQDLYIDNIRIYDKPVVIDPEVLPPYKPNFNKAEDYNAITIVNNNNDKFYWNWQKDNNRWMVETLYSSSDDWLFTPGIYMEKGAQYVVSFTACSSYPNYYEYLEVKYGNGAEVDKMNHTLMPKQKLTCLVGAEESHMIYYINCEKTGNYNIGFHSCNDYTGNELYLSDIKVLKVDGYGAPVAPAYIHAVRGENEGDVAISWAPVSKSEYGFSITPKYKLERLENDEWEIVAENLTETTYTENFASDTYKFITYRVSSNVDEVSSEIIESEVVTVGKTIEGGFKEGFEDGKYLYTWYSPIKSYGNWTITNESAADENGHSLTLNTASGRNSYLYSAIYSLKDFETPLFGLKLLKNSSKSDFIVDVIDVDNPAAEWKNMIYLSPADIYGVNTGEWGEQIIKLNNIVNSETQNVQFRITVNDGSDPIFIDDICLYEYEPPVLTPPYEPNFDNRVDYELMTVKRSETANTSWQWVSNAVHRGWFIKSYNNGSKTDDWLITPYIAMEEGETYYVDFSVYGMSSYYYEPLTVKIGNESDPNKWEQTLMPEELINWTKENKQNKHLKIECAETGAYKVGFYTSHNDGDGMYICDLKVYKEPVIPSSPENIVVKADANSSSLTWDAVSKSISGKEISNVKYNVEVYSENDWKLLASNLETASCPILENGLFEFRVQALFEDEVSDYSETGILYVGATRDEMNETFEDTDYAWYLDARNTTGSWEISNEYAKNEGDIAMKIHIMDYYSSDDVNIYSGIYSLTKYNPTYLDMYACCGNTGNSYLEVWYKDVDDKDSDWIKGTTLYTNGNEGDWRSETIDLTDMHGKNVQFRFTAKSFFGEADLYLDNIRLYEPEQYELIPTISNCPNTAIAGSEFDVQVKVSNHGVANAEGVTVELYKLGKDDVEELIASENDVYVNANWPTNIAFKAEMPKLQLEPIRLFAKVVFAKDGNQDNNTTSTAIVEPAHNNYAMPGSLTAKSIQWMDTNIPGIFLEWEHAQQGQKPYVESFESGADMSTEFGDWKLAGLSGAIGAYWDASDTSNSVYVWDATTETHKNISRNGYNGNSFSAHSGDKCIMLIGASSSNNSTDNWLMSPELSGDAQIVSFWYATSTVTYEDHLTVAYSYDFANTGSFEYICNECNNVDLTNVNDGQWHKMTVEIPAGAKYFAIHHTKGRDAAFLAIDDVTFVPKDASYVNAPRRAAEYAGDHLGYNVYRDGELLTETPTTDASYHDTGAQLNTEHVYHVTAAYAQDGENEGETNVVESKPVSLAYVMTDDNIIVTGVTEVVYDFNDEDAIFTLDGVRINRDNLQPGIYVVVRNGKANKVVVK